MRMWKVNPKKLCNKHLLGEHVEMHMFAGCIRKNKSIKGYVNNGLVEVHNIRSRHDLLALEMIKRGFNHKSPLPNFKSSVKGCVNVNRSIADLKKRCRDCFH